VYIYIYIHNLIYSIPGTTPRFPDFSSGEDLGLDCGKADERPGPSQGLDPSVSVPMEALHKTVHAHIFGHQNYSNDIFKWHFPGWSNALSKLKMSKSSKVKILNLDIFHSSKLHISCDYYYPLFFQKRNRSEAHWSCAREPRSPQKVSGFNFHRSLLSIPRLILFPLVGWLIEGFETTPLTTGKWW